MQQILLRVSEIAARVPGAGLDPWYEADAFNAHFRGDADDITNRYRDLAARFVGCDPVLDIGFGRGEFLELLARPRRRARAASRRNPGSSNGRVREVSRPMSAAVSSTCRGSTTTASADS